MNDNTITLDTEIVRGSDKISRVEVRKPQSGELRGANLADLLQMDVTSLHKVLPRITTPALTEHEVATMDPADLLQFGSKVAGFLLPKAAKQAASHQE